MRSSTPGRIAALEEQLHALKSAEPSSPFTEAFHTPKRWPVAQSRFSVPSRRSASAPRRPGFPEFRTSLTPDRGTFSPSGHPDDDDDLQIQELQTKLTHLRDRPRTPKLTVREEIVRARAAKASSPVNPELSVHADPEASTLAKLGLSRQQPTGPSTAEPTDGKPIAAASDNEPSYIVGGSGTRGSAPSSPQLSAADSADLSSLVRHVGAVPAAATLDANREAVSSPSASMGGSASVNTDRPKYNRQLLAVGEVVCRGPDWQYSNRQDGGPGNTGTVLRLKHVDAEDVEWGCTVRVLWANGNEKDYRYTRHYHDIQAVQHAESPIAPTREPRPARDKTPGPARTIQSKLSLDSSPQQSSRSSVVAEPEPDQQTDRDPSPPPSLSSTAAAAAALQLTADYAHQMQQLEFELETTRAEARAFKIRAGAEKENLEAEYAAKLQAASSASRDANDQIVADYAASRHTALVVEAELTRELASALEERAGLREQYTEQLDQERLRVAEAEQQLKEAAHQAERQLDRVEANQQVAAVSAQAKQAIEVIKIEMQELDIRARLETNKVDSEWDVATDESVEKSLSQLLENSAREIVAVKHELESESKQVIELNGLVATLRAQLEAADEAMAFKQAEVAEQAVVEQQQRQQAVGLFQDSLQAELTTQVEKVAQMENSHNTELQISHDQIRQLRLQLQRTVADAEQQYVSAQNEAAQAADVSVDRCSALSEAHAVKIHLKDKQLALVTEQLEQCTEQAARASVRALANSE